MINGTHPLKLTTVRDTSDFPDVFVGCVTLPSGQILSTHRMRTSRSSARRDAAKLARSLLADPDVPLGL